MNDTINKAAGAYVSACLELSGKVKTDGNNPHFKSKFATLEAVLDTILPACHKHNIVPMQEIIKAEVGIAVKTSLYHVSGDILELHPCPIPVDKNTAQGVISASTYGRRVSLMAIFGLAPTEKDIISAADDDGNAATAAPPKEEPKVEPDEETVARLYEAAITSKSEFLKEWKVTKPEMRATLNPELMDKFEALCKGEKVDL